MFCGGDNVKSTIDVERRMSPWDFSRRHVLTTGSTAFLSLLAGCSSVLRRDKPRTGVLRIRVRNISNTSHEVTIRVFLDNRETSAFEQSVTLAAPGKAPHTERFWPSAVENVTDEVPYRVIIFVDGTRHKIEDRADCIYHNDQEGDETVWISIQDDQTKILTDDCPAR